MRVKLDALDIESLHKALDYATLPEHEGEAYSGDSNGHQRALEWLQVLEFIQNKVLDKTEE